MSISNLKLRIVLFQILILIAFVALGVQLWRLQILHTQGYQSQADANRFRLVPIDAPRGVIYDQQGRLLVRNIPSYTISIVPAALPEDSKLRQAVLDRLSELLQMPVSSKVASTGAAGTKPGIEELLEQNAATPYAPVPIKADVDKQVAFLVEEEHLYMPGVIVEITSQREYPSGTLTSHVLGYVGRIPAESVQDYLNQVDEEYTINDSVGLMGVEATHEQELRGRKGLKHIEVDAFER